MPGGPTSGVEWLCVTVHQTCRGSMPVSFLQLGRDLVVDGRRKQAEIGRDQKDLRCPVVERGDAVEMGS